MSNSFLDFKLIFEKAELADMKYYFVEQDQTSGVPLVSFATSYKNLTDLLS